MSKELKEESQGEEINFINNAPIDLLSFLIDYENTLLRRIGHRENDIKTLVKPRSELKEKYKENEEIHFFEKNEFENVNLESDIDIDIPETLIYFNGCKDCKSNQINSKTLTEHIKSLYKTGKLNEKDYIELQNSITNDVLSKKINTLELIQNEINLCKQYFKGDFKDFNNDPDNKKF
jgi:hypothetical protein